MKKSIFLSLTTCIIFFSCASTPKIDSYLLESSVQQDFFRATTLKGANLDAEMDFTVRTEKNQITKIVCNFSLLNGKKTYSQLDQAFFTLDNGEKIPLTDITTLFIDRNKNVCRFSSLISPENFLLLIQQKKPIFNAIVNSVSYEFKPTPAFMTQLRGAATQFID